MVNPPERQSPGAGEGEALSQGSAPVQPPWPVVDKSSMHYDPNQSYQAPYSYGQVAGRGSRVGALLVLVAVLVLIGCGAGVAFWLWR